MAIPRRSAKAASARFLLWGTSLLAMAMLAMTGMASAAQAQSDHSYVLKFTSGLGAYPRSAPAYESRTGDVRPEGSTISASCWTRGGTITNPSGYTSDVWVRDDAGLYWSEAWLDTGSYGVPEGLASCDATDAASTEPQWQPNCTPGGDYISGTITTTSTENGVRISLTPTDKARQAWGNGDGWNSTVAMWHSIQDCVPGLYDGTADSVWQQLECHQMFATIKKPSGAYGTGETYDLEAWTDPLRQPGKLNYLVTRCLNHPDDVRFVVPLTLFAMTDDGSSGIG